MSDLKPLQDTRKLTGRLVDVPLYPEGFELVGSVRGPFVVGFIEEEAGHLVHGVELLHVGGHLRTKIRSWV